VTGKAGCPSAAQGRRRLDITYTYDLDGMLRARVEDHKTGRS
jgi:hypothetical protein